MKGFSQIIIFITLFFIAIIVLGIYVLNNQGFGGQIDESGKVFEIDEYSKNSTGEIPSGLSLPFKISDIDGENGALNPLGLVRFSKDQGDIGHPGIDFTLIENASVYAVADGEIVLIDTAGDQWGGMKIFQLLEKTAEGEGWGFLYEHVKGVEGLKVGDKVVRGELIATKAAPMGFTAHFQLSRLFNNYQFIREPICWPEYLDEYDGKSLQDWWSEYRQTDQLINGWRTNEEEGEYPFRDLLEIAFYPDGPEMCYDLGTDVR